ncbi:TolC family protein [Oscillatoria sp. CS-180]|uniref:TolC family protein n=1 Tax=Oscillatoria sp. CS-180 TaxID=3021720 RepID=UPI00232ED48C|nr:TolC family protein [Oscillatoria sp. CS-180]MDB9526623.1 TolC family protein [Oscillatoria sp. CS-180]
MPYPRLTRFHLSAAIALPSIAFLWLAVPAGASENTYVQASDETTLSSEDSQTEGDPGSIAPTALSSEVERSSTQPSFGPETTSISPQHVHHQGYTLTSPAARQPVLSAASPVIDGETATAPASSVATEEVLAITDRVLPTVEPPPFEVLFSQAEPDLPPSAVAESSDIDESEETVEAIDIEVVYEDSDTLDTEAPAATTTVETETISTETISAEAGDTDTHLSDSAEADNSIEQDDADTTPTLEADDTEEEDVFSPLPESEEDADANEDTELEDLSQPTPEAPDQSLNEAVPIPADRVLDELPYLDPDPNPLLIQTQPEEVEIIGVQPLSLEEAIELSYRNNPDLRVAVLELEQSQASLREAQADNFPTVSVNGNLQGQNVTTGGGVTQTPGGGFSFDPTSEELGVTTSAQVDVVYNVYSSGLRQSNIQAAVEQVELSELEVERRQEELRLVTANEYYDLQAAIESIRISQAFLEEAQRNLADTELREEVGIGTRFDVLRARVQVANAQQDLVNSERARQVAQRTLARRLNVPPSINITTTPVDIAGAWPLDLEESIVLAFQNRAELEQQLVQRELNDELRQAELAALGPQVDLFANYTISDTLTEDDSFDDNYSFGARVSWTLFDGGAARARAAQREIESEIAERNFEESRNTVRLGVESAYFNLQSNFENISTARLAVEQAEEARDLAILRFDAGVGTQLEILEAQSELTDAEVNLVQAIVGYNRSLAELERAVSNLAEPYYEELPF